MARAGRDEIEPREAARWLASGEAVALDVRQQHEWDAGHILEAVHVPAADVQRHLGDLPQDSSLVVVCRSGNRSRQVVDVLKARGYRALNLRGGMRAWHADELPMEPSDGRVV